MLFFISFSVDAEWQVKKPDGVGNEKWSSLKTAVQSAKLIANDANGADTLGEAVSLDGNRALVGAPSDWDNGSNSGSAYVFEFDGISWSQTAKLLAFDGATSDGFGGSVSLYGDRALIGAQFNDAAGNASGSAYIFDFDGISWSKGIKIVSDDLSASDFFGNSVSLYGDRALVGAVQDDDFGDASGSAYIFEFDGQDWTQTAKLKPFDGAFRDFFGVSVSLGADRALVGSYNDDDFAPNSGAAYVFDYTEIGTWLEMGKLRADDGAEDDLFGYSVSLSGDRALVGAYGNDDNGSFSGSAYIFEFDNLTWTWSQTMKLNASDGTANDFFGYTVSLSGDYALVGAYFDEGQAIRSGSAYYFYNDGKNWIEKPKLIASEGQADDGFGFAVSLYENRALVGTPYDDEGTFGAGAAYVFVLDDVIFASDFDAP